MLILLISILGVVVSVGAAAFSCIAANLAIDQTRIVTDIASRLLNNDGRN